MLTGAGDMVSPANRRPELYRWKRTGRRPGSKPAFDYDNVEHWIKRVEEASEFAVSEVFSPKKPARRLQRAPNPALDLESSEQLHDHDDAYTEAQGLLSEWLGTKLRLELASDDDNEPEDDATTLIKPPPPPEFMKYNRFDDLYHYLEQETEDSSTQDFVQQLLQKEVVDSGILENLKNEKSSGTVKPRDPRVTMDVRHQQVKENRARRQRETEKQKHERAIRKSALSQAQKLIQEENRQKTLKAKKEDEEIQREVVKLRKEMNERKRTMEEARKIEWRRQELENKKTQERVLTQRDSQEHELERRRLEKRAKIQELLSQVYADNHRCLQKYFSIWYQLVLERRVKMGKARALADWKHQLRTFRAWRHHVWTKKIARETQQMELELKDQNRKQQVAVESYRKRLLRRCLVEWQLWCRAEKEKRELEARKAETKRKMAALLDAASSLRGHKQSGENQVEVNGGSGETTQREVEESRSVVSDSKIPIIVHQNTPENIPTVPKHAWQVMRQHAALISDELEQHRLQSSSTPQRPGHQRRAPTYGENFENRHLFQQKLIDEQRRQLEEQKQMILGLVENQRLMISKQEARRATAVMTELSGQARPPSLTRRRGSVPSMEESSPLKHDTPQSLPLSSAQSDRSNTSPTQSAVSTAQRTGGPSTPHPAVRAMEERAAQRAERKRILEELRRRREEEKLAQLREEEKQRLEMEAAEKESQLERKREEKRLQKQKDEERQRRLQQDRDFWEKAKLHHEKRLLRSWGLEPWKKLVARCRYDMERAESHHRCALLRRGLQGWLHAVREIVAEKNQRAERLGATLLLRRTFQQWVKYKDYLTIQEERAERRYQANLRRKTFTAWLDLAEEEKLAMWEKQRISAEHNQRRILLTALRTWRQFPKFMRELRLKEERREALRKRVAEILPDFRV